MHFAACPLLSSIRHQLILSRSNSDRDLGAAAVIKTSRSVCRLKPDESRTALHDKNPIACPFC